MANGTIALEELESHLWEAANIFRGTVEVGGGLEKALEDWLESSKQVRGALEALLVEVPPSSKRS